MRVSITTKAGDGGQTSLYSGEQVWKDDLRVDAYGSLDELDAHLGDARHQVQDPAASQIMLAVQETLYRVMGQLATPGAPYPYPITDSDVADLTRIIADWEARVPLQGFVLPGSLPASAKLDLCRTVARRAERLVVRLARAETVAPELLAYVNRLSDLLFILARGLEAAAGAIRYKHKPDSPH